jgi:Zn-dependent protease/predicted transcriptional regulator
MGTSLTIFRFRGISVRVHWSFLLILAYGAFAYSAAASTPLLGAIYGVITIVLLFACVTLHEFGHALVARHYGIGVRDITLLPIGGVANLQRLPENPGQELLIAIAGPLVNFALALLLLPFTLLAIGWEMRAGSMQPGFMQILQNLQTPGFGNLLLYLFATNILLGAFNLLPAFPMDGGRILRALLAMALNYVQATRIAVLVGRMMAVLLAMWGIFLWTVGGGGIILLLIAFFVYVGGGAEREAVESRAVLRHHQASEALPTDAVNLYASEELSRAVDLIMNSYQTDFAVFDLGGSFIGVLTRARLIHALREQGPDARVVDVMLPAAEIPVCAPDTSLADVWEKMTTSGKRVAAVFEGHKFLGLITLDDIAEVLHVLAAAMQGQGRRAAGGMGQQVGESVQDA